MQAYVTHSEPCPKCREKGLDRTGDNLKVYSNGGKYCFSCNKAIKVSEDLKPSKMYSEEDFVTTDYTVNDWIEESQKKNLTSNPEGYRGLDENTCNIYKVKHEFAVIDGVKQLINQYYPITKEGGFSGIKRRIVHPKKDFRSKGYNKADCDLFGQNKFASSTSKFVIIASGELDALSTYQLVNCKEGLLKYDASGERIFPIIPVVSGTAGELSSLKQYQNNYAFLNRFETIYIIPDKDAKGEEALHKVAQVLPRDKLKVINLPNKDANDMLVNGFRREFIQAFWNAKYYSPVGIYGSDAIYEKIIEKASLKKIKFPEFLDGLNRATAGGITQGTICNITAGSGCGKSTLVNQLVLDYIVNNKAQVGIVSLEADLGDYGENLLSAYIERKLQLFDNEEEKVAFLQSPEMRKKGQELFTRDGKAPSFQVIDDRGDFSCIKDKIEALIVSCGCQLIVIDVLSDIFDGESMDFQAKWMAWEKAMNKRYNVTFINIIHTRKGGSGQKAASSGAVANEEDMSGSGTQYRSASLNIILSRDKTAEDEFVRNTIDVHLTKNRQTGWTGKPCQLFYNMETHKLSDAAEMFAQQSSDVVANGYGNSNKEDKPLNKF